MKQYWFNNSLVDAQLRKEVINVKGGDSVVENISLTVFGPVMYDHTFHN